MDTYGLKPYCEGAVKFAQQFEKNFSYKPEDIDDLENILEIVHRDYESKKLNDQGAEEIAVSLGIYLGQVLLDNKLSECGYRWEFEETEPCLKKDDRKMYPLSKVLKRIKNGSEDSVKSFYKVAIAIAQGQLPLK
ncbi:MAG: hypothetical protein Q4F95_09550 [Oscillospiraceae bacterium]|nr:hypothetical protein [Oscillospiraceae bacterium]